MDARCWVYDAQGRICAQPATQVDPTRGMTVCAAHAPRTAPTMPRILQPITGLEPVSNGHRTTFLERLACGHTGQSRATRQAVEQAIQQGRRRRCFRCTHGR